MRMKWIVHDYHTESSCGRFIIRRVCMNPKYWGYWGLTDTKTGTEHPFRLESGAKAGAKRILNMEQANAEQDH